MTSAVGHHTLGGIHFTHTTRCDEAEDPIGPKRLSGEEQAFDDMLVLNVGTGSQFLDGTCLDHLHP
jgi:hypothetical protein